MENLRNYVEAIKARSIKEGGGIDPVSEMLKFIEWATEQADRRDPLLNKNGRNLVSPDFDSQE